LVSEEQVNALVAYVKSLAQPGTAAAATKTAVVVVPKDVQQDAPQDTPEPAQSTGTQVQ
jgi:hypothetical protein